MWHLEEELEEWFQEVKRLRDQEYGGTSDSEAPMTQNDLTQGMRDG
jgi:hypothetical protein